MKSIIIYTLTTAPSAAPELYTQVGPVWIRCEAFNGSDSDALDQATPRPGETVSNTHPLPEPVYYRFLNAGEIVDGRDEFLNTAGTSWQPVILTAGCPFDPLRWHLHRRRLESHTDAY